MTDIYPFFDRTEPGGLPNKGSHGCAASAKPRPGKISTKNLMPGQKSAQKPNDRASFHEL